MSASRDLPAFRLTTLRGATGVPSRARRAIGALCAGLLASALALPAGVAQAQEGPQMNLRRVELTVCMLRIDVQVALTPQERQTGLMYRKEMPAHEGMLFVFGQPS